MSKDWKNWLPRPSVLVAIALLLGVFLWTYFSAGRWLVRVWWNEPEYGHGFFVPLFCFYLLWHRRDSMPAAVGRGSLWALPLFAASILMRWTSVYFYYEWLEPASLIPAIAGAVLFVGGWPVVRWAWPALIFMCFMVPLPGFMSGMLSQPLQRIGTVASVYAIQTLGIPAIAQGNVISLLEGQLGVVEACSGLRMLMLFFTLCVGAAFVIHATVWERVVIVVSAVPIAVFSNVARITLTAILYEAARRWPGFVSTETADYVFHELAGLLMMPLGMMILWGEMILISKLLLEPAPQRPLSLAEARAGSGGRGGIPVFLPPHHRK